VQDPSLGRGFPLKTNVFKVICVPQGDKIALYRSLIVNVARPGKYVGANGLGGNGSVAMNFDGANQILLCSRLRSHDQRQKTKEQNAPEIQASLSE
jgi:D-arabinose 1-dehydrogenase-like Zn-dependent alcohol dehydrogenase